MALLRPLLGVALALAPTTSAQQLTFSDQSQAAGLDFTLRQAVDHHGGPMGGGGTVGDFNRDGWPDVFVPSMGVDPDRLFINHQGVFVDEAASWGLTRVHRGCGAAVGDYDGNGYPDLFVSSTGAVPGPKLAGQNLLYRNEGNGSFTEVAAQAGVATTGRYADGWGAAFGDYDLDGDLDLYTTTWLSLAEGNRLFRNEGDGTFVDVTIAAGVFAPTMKAFAPRFVDVDRDRYPELFPLADFGTTEIYANLRDGTFADVTPALTPDLVHNGMGSDFADVDGDGWLDWYATSIWYDPGPGSTGEPNGNRLYFWKPGRNEFEALPENHATTVDGGWAWGTALADFDHDGDVDIAATNGWETPEFQNEQSYLWLNAGNGTDFSEVALACGFTHFGQGRGLVKLDYDRDGDLDLLLFTNQGDTKLFRNDVSGAAAHWLRVVLDTSAHPALAPDGYGTYVEVDYDDQGTTRTLVSYLDGGCNYLGNSEATLHFGLGAATVADEIRVFWADGFRSRLENVSADQILTIAATPPLTATPLQAGQNADLVVTGSLPGEPIYFAYSAAGLGPGPCYGEFGGLCMDVLDPVVALGRAVADSDGVATLSARLPVGAAGSTVFAQAAARRGSAGSESVKTNVFAATILP